ADVDDQQFVVNERRRRGAEEVLRHPILAAKITAPHQCPRFEGEAVEFALRADREASLPGNDRARARPIVVAVAILEGRAVAEAPPAGTGFRVQALDDFLVTDAMKEQQPFPDDSR